MRSKKRMLSVLVGFLMVGGAAQSNAEDGAQTLVLEEIVVTARKRAENLQETPVSVLAFSEASLEKQNVTNLAELSAKLPNVFLGGGAGFGSANANFSIRGMGTVRNAINQEYATALYIDDAYISRSDGALLDILDIESIEVLRGPQGTLFGRNATSGAVRYLTNKPSEEFEGRVKATFGSDSRTDVQGAVNIPVSDFSALRLSGGVLRQDGFITNGLGQDLGNRSSEMLRVYYRWTPTAKAEILLSADHTRTDRNGDGAALLALRPNALIVMLAAGPAGGFLDPKQDIIGDYYRNSSLSPSYYKLDNTGASATLNYDFLENLSLKVVGTYRDMEMDAQHDFDAAAAILIENRVTEREMEMYSLEAQLSGLHLDGRLNWTAGIFLYEEEASDSRLLSILGTQENPGGTFRINDPHEIESQSIYGQGTYDLTEKLSVTLGLRASRDEKSILARETLPNRAPVMFAPDDVNGNSGPLVVSNDADWSAVSGRFSLEYKATDDAFIYASYARGYRAGGINDRPLAATHVITFEDPSFNYGINAIDEEILDVYEIGLRSELFNNSWRFNVTGFYQDLKDFQVQRTSDAGVTIIQNAAGAEGHGIEAEIDWVISESITLDFDFGWMETEFTEVDPGVALAVGDALGNSPKFSYNFGVDYATSVLKGSLDVRVDYSWTDDYYSDPNIANQYDIESHGLLSANVKYTPVSELWAVVLYGNNLTDEEYLTYALDFRPGALGFAQGAPGRGREVGIGLEYNF